MPAPDSRAGTLDSTADGWTDDPVEADFGSAGEPLPVIAISRHLQRSPGTPGANACGNWKKHS